MKFTHDEKKGKLRIRDDNGVVVAVISDEYVRYCPVCQKPQMLELRQTSDGVVRDQPRCGSCRSKKG